MKQKSKNYLALAHAKYREDSPPRLMPSSEKTHRSHQPMTPEQVKKHDEARKKFAEGNDLLPGF